MVLLLLPQPCDAQTILNGDFEDNTSIGCDWNMPNEEYTSKMANSTAFLGAFGGVGEIDIMEGDCGYSSPPQSGTTKIGIATMFSDPSHVDAISLDLSSPLLPGSAYRLCFYAEGNTEIPGSGGMIADIQVGESTSPTAFGTLLFSVTPTNTGWTQFCQVFTASTNSSYITVKNTEGQLGWNHLDNFTLQALSPYSMDRVSVTAVGQTASSPVYTTIVVAGQDSPSGAASVCNTGYKMSLGFLSVMGNLPVPILMRVEREPSSASEVQLSWSGAEDYFDLYRAFNPQNIVDFQNLHSSPSSCTAVDANADEADIIFYKVMPPTE
jgi:hypothetical protein